MDSYLLAVSSHCGRNVTLLCGLFYKDADPHSYGLYPCDLISSQSPRALLIPLHWGTSISKYKFEEHTYKLSVGLFMKDTFCYIENSGLPAFLLFAILYRYCFIVFLFALFSMKHLLKSLSLFSCMWSFSYAASKISYLSLVWGDVPFLVFPVFNFLEFSGSVNLEYSPNLRIFWP